MTGRIISVCGGRTLGETGDRWGQGRTKEEESRKDEKRWLEYNKEKKNKTKKKNRIGGIAAY